MIHVAVVGVGAFGRNHARVYQQLAKEGMPVRLAAVVDADPARVDAVAKEFGCRGLGSVAQLIHTHQEIQAASVAVPTIHHLGVSKQLMEAGIDVLIEKPIAGSVAEAEELISVAKKQERVAQAGHLERFNPAVRATMPVITRPMFFEVHRLSVFTPRSLDIDVVLDLMIHDLDIVLAFTRSKVKEIRAVGLPILSGKVDIANVRVELESGCIANFTASRVSTERVRKLRFFQPRQYISLDYGRQDVLMFTVGSDTQSGTPSANPQIRMEKVPTGQQEPLYAELKSFLEAVKARRQPEVTLEDGGRALGLALAIVDQIRAHSDRIKLDDLRH